MKITQKALLVPVLVVAMAGSGAIAGYASITQADTTEASQQGFGAGKQMGRAPFAQDGDHVFGTVTAISGSLITITDSRTTTPYTIDASNAAIVKATLGEGPSEATLADIAVGDTVGAHGTLSGTTLTADRVTDGAMGGLRDGGMGMMRGGRGGSMGTVSAVNGSTITLTTPGGDTVTVDASGATFGKVISGSLLDVVVGDTISFHGQRSDKTVTADHIMTGMQVAQRAQQ